MRKSPNPFAQKRQPPPARDRLAEQALGRAIADRLVVAFSYGGKDRTFAPHVVRETEDANVIVYGIQISSSDPFAKRGERSFTVAEIHNLRTTGESFTKDPAFDVRKYREGVLYIIQGF